jgi:hypothetical protein
MVAPSILENGVLLSSDTPGIGGEGRPPRVRRPVFLINCGEPAATLRFLSSTPRSGRTKRVLKELCATHSELDCLKTS